MSQINSTIPQSTTTSTSDDFGAFDFLALIFLIWYNGIVNGWNFYWGIAIILFLYVGVGVALTDLRKWSTHTWTSIVEILAFLILLFLAGIQEWHVGLASCIAGIMIFGNCRLHDWLNKLGREFFAGILDLYVPLALTVICLVLMSGVAIVFMLVPHAAGLSYAWKWGFGAVGFLITWLFLLKALTTVHPPRKKKK